MSLHTTDEGERLRFRGAYDARDVEALAQFTVSQVLDRRIGRATASAAILVVLAALLLHSWPVAILGFLGVIAVSAAVRYVILPRGLLRHARQVQGLEAQREIEVDAEGIRHRCGGSEQVIPRRDLRRLVLRKEHLFLILKPRGCLMLPLAWIQSPATIETVVTLLVGPRHDS